MSKLRNIFYAMVSLALVFSLSGCHKVVVLQPRGSIADQEKHLLLVALGLMLIIVIPVILLTLIIARRYRASNTKAKYTPNWCHSNLLEFAWWVAPCIIIVILATLTWVTTHALDPYKPLNAKALGVTAKPITIEAISLRWKWLFIYPKQGIATVNYVQFPVNTPIRFKITSDAPMNSFQIQQLAGQIYAMNGMQTKLHMIASQKGTYRGRSVSFSGLDFANMRFQAKVTSAADFNHWVSHVRHVGGHLSMAKYHQLVQPSKKTPVMLFSSVKKDLFKTVMMSFMKPDMNKAEKQKVENYKGVQL